MKEGIKRGWEVEHMLEPRTCLRCSSVLPNGEVIIVNGGQTGYAAFNAALTPLGNILVAGSNPNGKVVNGTKFATEFRVEYLNPPYMSMERPVMSNVPTKIGFSQQFNTDVTIPMDLKASSIKVALMDLGFSSHAFHSSSRLVSMEA
ncbi:hypothetical protein D9613_006357 [Agrocybe pediades]|uniref:Galactose oxidase-like Early set domain-containing protein n=1 Tax=Agrocybe pediades TaxID=84607 RepID=A0A8H4QV94_9AGAR|nr:hypothetical protein D9613_006357 [Agrocybe pediades]